MEVPAAGIRINERTPLVLGDVVSGQPNANTPRGDLFLRVWIAALSKWGLYRPGRGVDPNELPNAVLSTVELIDLGFTLPADRPADANDACFIYTHERVWKEVPKGTDPLV